MWKLVWVGSRKLGCVRRWKPGGGGKTEGKGGRMRKLGWVGSGELGGG